MHVIGTAGHVDHGKSSLVLALTGINPDRLKEEQEREMTIDLGFAWLTLPGGERVGIIDVPGHIDFIKNMLAGVGGIDAALFIVAADEGMMPQSREHLAILDLLRVSAGVVALTKADLAPDVEWLDLVQAEIREALAGTSLAGAAIVSVSARTGQGLPALLAALDEVVARTPARRDRGRPRLPVDRVFTVAGFGTVVTGTLVDGAFTIGQEVEIVPSAGLRARIRGLQTHREKIAQAVPGSRVAMNLTGVDVNQVRRGQVVALPEQVQATLLADARLYALSNVPGPLHHHAIVDFFSGSAQVSAHVRLLDTEELAPGAAAWAQLQLSEPVALAAGDHFIIRQPSPSRTLGGGQVVNPAPGRRYRRLHPGIIAQLETLARGAPADLLLAALEREEPATAGELLARSGLAREAALAALGELIRSEQVIVLSRDPEGSGLLNSQQPLAGNVHLLSRSGWSALRERIGGALSDYHRQYPLRAGMPREELKSRLQRKGVNWPPKLFNEIVARAVAEGVLAEGEGTVRAPDHTVRFTPEQQQRIDGLLLAFRRNPSAPPSLAEAAAGVGADVLQALMDQGALVKASEDVIFLREEYDRMVAAVLALIQSEGSITVAQVRDRFTTSRKYALALMEHLDERKVTRRVGDARVLR
ncbi:MAG: selenocysteine-specific translation elongation factor [Anaerolineae bacterium]|nr:selenocysteine-specific translation elongation factor [Anaerolineae bacterium]